jgi:hypothetical protein
MIPLPSQKTVIVCSQIMLLILYYVILQPSDSDQYHSQLPEISYIEYTWMTSLSYQYTIKLWFFPSGGVRVYLWMFKCGNIVHLTRFLFGVTRFTNLNTIVIIVLM